MQTNSGCFISRPIFALRSSESRTDVTYVIPNANYIYTALLEGVDMDVLFETVNKSEGGRKDLLHNFRLCKI